jgi:hypothetical protein
MCTRNRFDLEYDRQILEFEAAQKTKEGFKQCCAERSGPTIDMMAGKYHDCLRYLEGLGQSFNHIYDQVSLVH